MSKGFYLDFLAKTGNAFIHTKGETATELLLKQLNCGAGQNILEFGCGTGATLVKLAVRNPQSNIFATDISVKMIDQAKARLKFCGCTNSVNINLCKSSKLSYADNSFDKIYMESVLAIQEHPSESIKEIYRVLKPGGSLLINETMWRPTTPIVEIKKINNFCREHFGIIQSSDEYPYLENWLDLFSGNGLKLHFKIDLDNVTRNVSYQNKIEILSHVFSFKEKVKSLLSPGVYRERKKYQSSISMLNYSQPYLTSYILEFNTIKT